MSHPDPAGSSLPTLEEVLAAYLQARESGEAPDPDALIAAHPHLEQELREFLANERNLQVLVTAAAESGEQTHGWRHGAADGQEHATTRLTQAPSHFPPAAFPDHEILAEIARGGMGIVYRARQISLKRLVALKVMLGGTAAYQERLQRFRREAEAVAGLEHPGIVPIYEVGEVGGRPYFSMKLIDGPSLDRELDRLSGDHVLIASIMARTARAMDHAHQRGILHRDLKPANILLDAENRPHVTDFGLAKRVTSEEDLTLTDQVLGTPGYMSPEQAAGKGRGVVTAATDIWSLGAILYTLLCGRPPFLEDTPVATLKRIVEEEPIPPSRIRRGIPGSLQQICLKCLRKEPRSRYRTAGEMADDLERYLRNEPVRARPVGLLERVFLWSRRRPARAALAATSLLAAAVVAVLAVGLGEQSEAIRMLSVLDLLQKADVQFDPPQPSPAAALYYATAETLLPTLRGRIGLRASETPVPERILTLPGSGSIWRLRHLPETGRLAVATSNGVLVLELPSGTVTRRLLEGRVVHGLAISPDGSLLATGDDLGEVRLWDTHEFSEVVTLQPALPGEVNALTFSPDGRQLAAAGGVVGIARIWQLDAQGRPALPDIRIDDLVLEVQYLPGLQELLLGGKDRVYRWGLKAGRPVGDILEHEGEVWRMLLASGGRVLATTDNVALRLWSVAGWQEIATTTNDSPIGALAVSRDGCLLATGSRFGDVRAWRLGDGRPRQMGRPLLHGATVYAVVFSRDGRRLITGDKEGVVRIWAIPTDAPPAEREPQAHHGLFLPDSTGESRLWVDHPAGQASLLVAGSSAARASLNLGSPPWGGTTVPGGWRVVTCDLRGGPVVLWTLRPQGDEILSESRPLVAGGPAAPRPRAMSADGRRLVVQDSEDGTRLLDADTGRTVGGPFPEDTRDVALSADGSWLLLVNRESVGVRYHVEASTLTPRGPPLEGLVAGSLYAISCDGAFTLSTHRDRNTVRVWHRFDGQWTDLPHPDAPEINVLGLVLDDRVVITVDSRHRVVFWEAATGERLLPPLTCPLPAGARPWWPLSMSLSTSGRRLFIQSGGGVIWSLDTSWLAALDEPAPSPEERKRNLLRAQLCARRRLDPSGNIEPIDPEEWGRLSETLLNGRAPGEDR